MSFVDFYDEENVLDGATVRNPANVLSFLHTHTALIYLCNNTAA